MRRIVMALAAFGALVATPVLAQPGDGIVTKRSRHSVEATMAKLEAAVAAKGLTVFAKIDHAAGAAKAGQTLRATMLLIFGNPETGTPLMRSAQTAALDLPQRVIVYATASGVVQISYNDPQWLAARHRIKDQRDVVAKTSAALAALTDAAVR